MKMTSQQVNEKVNREMQMYGMCDFDIRREYMESITARFSGLEMVVAGILSDCQEELAGSVSASDERVRKQLNIAKFILFEMMDSKREEVLVNSNGEEI